MRSVACSNGAPSARNLLVTIFGDALLPHGDDTTISVRALTALVEPFSANERLVRTSLTRLVNDRLLRVVTSGRRSFYGVAPSALDLFRSADHRIYGGPQSEWDHSWTIVVIDGSEGTARTRARLRQELAWVGLGPVAPNVMASPVVGAEEAAQVVTRNGGFSNVLVSRSQVVEAPGTVGVDELAHRVAELGEVAARYAEFVAEFARFDPARASAVARTLDPQLAFKLRTLLIAAFRRIALDDPQLPPELLPADWVGRDARALAGRIYAAVAQAGERFLASVAEPALQPRDWSIPRFTSQH